MKRALLLLVVLAAGCGLLGPEIDCGDVPHNACRQAIIIATAEVQSQVGPSSWFESSSPGRIVVRLGCGDRPCPPAVYEKSVSVTFYPPGEGRTHHAYVLRAEVDLPDG